VKIPLANSILTGSIALHKSHDNGKEQNALIDIFHPKEVVVGGTQKAKDNLTTDFADYADSGRVAESAVRICDICVICGLHSSGV
jgi:hypothetical protein